MFSVIKDHITQCKGAANGCVFNSFWTSLVARRMRYIVRINAKKQDPQPDGCPLHIKNEVVT